MKIWDIIKLKTRTLIITEKLSDNDYRVIDNNWKTWFFNKRKYENNIKN